MRQLLYVSLAAQGLAPAALNAILSTARTANALLGVSGLLLFTGNGFVQMLEGDERALRELYGRIAADRRHREPRLLLDREAPPAFGGWSMGFERPDPNDPETAGLFGVCREAIENRLAPGTGRIVALMLETFYRVHRDDALRARAS